MRVAQAAAGALCGSSRGGGDDTLCCARAAPVPRRLQVVETAHRLALEWSAWVVRSSALRKVFVSVKGIYFQVSRAARQWSCGRQGSRLQGSLCGVPQERRCARARRPQADVMGQAVTWLVPHQLAQVLPLDVDYKVRAMRGLPWRPSFPPLSFPLCSAAIDSTRSAQHQQQRRPLAAASKPCVLARR